MKSRWLMIALFAVVLQALPVAGQVLPLHRAAAPGGVVPASCNSCLSGHGGAVMADSGTVWGTSCDPCLARPRLFAPCPNPCQRTLLGDVVFGIRDAVDCGLNRVGCCLLGGCGLPCVGEAYGGCAPCDSMGGEQVMTGETYESVGQPQAAAPSVMPQPVPQAIQAVPTSPTTTPAQPQANPFADEPVQGSGVKPAPQAAPARSAKAPVRPTGPQSVRGRVQRTSFEEPAELLTAAAPPTKAPAAAKRAPSPRRSASLREASGKELQLTPVQGEAAPAIRFRGE